MEWKEEEDDDEDEDPNDVSCKKAFLLDFVNKRMFITHCLLIQTSTKIVRQSITTRTWRRLSVDSLILGRSGKGAEITLTDAHCKVVEGRHTGSSLHDVEKARNCSSLEGSWIVQTNTSLLDAITFWKVGLMFSAIKP